jgi:hypothetical protein
MLAAIGAGSNSRLATQRLVQRTATRALSEVTAYKPTLTNRRSGEWGIGGRGSDAGLKVAVFGASGFLGSYVCSELGTCIVVQL